VHISFHLLDFTDKADYLKWGDLQFDIFSTYGLVPVQVITWETMVELTQRNHELFKDGKSNGGRFGTLMVKDGTSTVMVPPTLSEKIRNDHEIKHPVVLQVTGTDGRPYSAVFDDEPHPKLHYETWDEICYEYSFIEHAEVKVDEPIWQFSWGPLQASRPPTSYKVMFEKIPYFNFETRFEGVDDFSGSASTAQLKKILNGRASLKINEGKEFERFEIELNHIKPQALPTEYHFEYFDGKPTNDQDVKNLIEQLSPGDFLDIKRIAPLNQRKHLRFYFKVGALIDF
jgi:hypothetical protein